MLAILASGNIPVSNAWQARRRKAWAAMGPGVARRVSFRRLAERVRVYQPAEFVGGDIKLLVALTLDSIAQPALEAGLTNSDEIHTASRRLHELVKDGDTVMSMPRIVQAWGRLP